MTLITFQDGKPVLRDGKVGTEQGCCCGGSPACCQHFCSRMCCNQIKWVVPEDAEYFTTVESDCRSTLPLPESSVRIRVRVRCGGWFWEGYDDGCDTDCEIVEVEYSEDGGTTWTDTPPGSVSGITWSVYCLGDAEQPAAVASAPRCAALTTLNAEQCAAADGEPCSLPSCPDCGLPCGPPPTEWRLVDGDKKVWFAGDIVPHPLYTGEGEVLCQSPGPGSQPKLLLENFPFSNDGAGCDVSYAPAGWPVTLDFSINLDLEVLGCDGNNWTLIEAEAGGSPCFSQGSFFYGVPPTIDPCEISSYWPWWINRVFQSPPGCSCLRDPGTGEMIAEISGESLCCPQCNWWLEPLGCGTGLEFHGHGEAVRFAGDVPIYVGGVIVGRDSEGSNLWNWQDSLGRSPAGTWPTGAITIAGELRSWRAGGPRYHPDFITLDFPSVTLEPGAVLAISLTTETLTVDDAAIEELAQHSSGLPKYCANGGLDDGRGLAVGITVTGTATFKNGAENHAVGDTAAAVALTPFAGINGNCVFESGSKNFGTVAGNCDFSDDASNEGEIAGNCTFSGDAVNNGTITGDATFSGNATNAGTVTGNCTFAGNATNTGTVDGDATFSDTASMAGEVTGTATFTGSACHTSGTAGTFDPNPPPAC